MPLLEPKEITIKTLSGNDRTYIISKFPAIAGREIVASYPLTAVPKIAEYSQNEAVMIKLMAYVGVPRPVINGVEQAPLMLVTKELIDNHVSDWETLAKLEIEMMKYNTSFFGQGEISTFLGTITRKFLTSISPMLTPLLRQLLAAIKQPYTN